MIVEKIFCKNCGQKIHQSKIGFLTGDRYHEFQDGFYCEACAKQRVEKARSKK